MYAIGQTVRLTCAFATVAGVATDPTAVSVIVDDPTGNQTTYASPTKDSTGNYHQDVVPTSAGQWRYRWAGTGAVAAVAESAFLVKANSF